MSGRTKMIVDFIGDAGFFFFGLWNWIAQPVVSNATVLAFVLWTFGVCFVARGKGDNR
jgi:TPP-dependent indolepyruvate ferredoxin oxidoreductase alpha subunit